MFHTYVKATSGNKVDIDRARYLMDDALFRDAERDVVRRICPAGFNPFDIATAERCGYTTEYKANMVWHNYCRRHMEKYGTPFEPDVDPEWDQ
jgi:hypothetical protein